MLNDSFPTFANTTERIFNRWCSILVHLKQPLHFNTRLQNEVLHKSSLLPFFQESKLLGIKRPMIPAMATGTTHAKPNCDNGNFVIIPT